MARRPAGSPPELPGFTFIDTLGSGGFADVHRYEQLGRKVAVKVLTTDLSHNTQQAFEAEANLMARLSNHPAIVSIYQAGQAPDGRSYLVMEVCQPKHLGARIRTRTFNVPRALEVTIQIAGAVESAHRLGVLHRDIKPANILFTEFGRPALTDFGISVSTPDGQRGVGIGVSPAWAPPEQLSSGTPMTPASDVYSLAATCWAMLVGHGPFEQPGGPNDMLAISARVKNTPVPATGREDVPDELERILRTAMAKEPANRYETALDFARALQSIQTSLHLPTTPVEIGEDHGYDDGADLDREDLDDQVEGTRIDSPQDLFGPHQVPTYQPDRTRAGLVTPVTFTRDAWTAPPQPPQPSPAVARDAWTASQPQVPPVQPPRSKVPLILVGAAAVGATGIAGLLLTALALSGEDASREVSTPTPQQTQVTEPTEATEAATPVEEAESPSPVEVAAPLAINADYQNQPCSGEYIVMLATSGLVEEWESKLGAAVDGVPGAKYLSGEGSCEAFLSVDPVSNDPIYNAYLGPYPTLESACSTLAGLGERHDKAWVRMLANPSKVRELCVCLDSAESLPSVAGGGDITNLGVQRLVSQAQWAFVQMGLNDIEHIYGNFTPEFRQQIVDFQTGAGITATGVMDEAFWSALQASYCGPTDFTVQR